MCLACEQDAIWLAYLESQGLLKPDDPEAVDALFSAFPVQPLPIQGDEAEQQVNDPAKVADQISKNPFSCDDPTASAPDLKFLRPNRKQE
jgi:hypothetical protein